MVIPFNSRGIDIEELRPQEIYYTNQGLYSCGELALSDLVSHLQKTMNDEQTSSPLSLTVTVSGDELCLIAGGNVNSSISNKPLVALIFACLRRASADRHLFIKKKMTY